MDLELIIRNHISNYDKNNCFKSWHERDDEDYKAVLSMGSAAIPILVKLIGQSWFPVMALSDITGECPVLAEHAGMFDRINQDWLKWAKDNGYSAI